VIFLFNFIYRAVRHIYVKLLKKTKLREFSAHGINTRFSPHTSYFTYPEIKLGNNVFINSGAYFSGEIIVGDNVLFGPNVIITSGHHDYSEVGKIIEEQGRPKKNEILILSDSWIGAGSILLQKTKINEGTIIGAGSVVTKEMPPYCVCVGNPCKPINYRYSDSELKEHLLKMNRSNIDISKILEKRKMLFNANFKK
jgi:acetyltransferase-like isoleucine patch superfamily enzyme